MRTSTHWATCLIMACSLITSCSDSDEKTPKYKTPEGLHITTRPEAYTCQYVYSRSVAGSDLLLFYSDTFPVETLEGAMITIIPLSEPELDIMGLYNYNNTDPYANSHTTSWGLKKTFFTDTRKIDYRGPILPNCGESGTMFGLSLLVPEDGYYDLRFRIENPEKKLYYQTPVYRYTVKTDKSECYSTIIDPINR